MKKSLKMPVQRELGVQERLLNNVHRFAGLIGVQVMHLSGPLPTQTVRDALDTLQSRHLILQAHLKITRLGFAAGMPWFFLHRAFCLDGTHPIPLTIINQAQPDDWHQHMQKQLSTPIRGSKMPQVRATLMRVKDQPEKNVVFLATNHAIADAQAANMMTCQVLELLGGIHKDKRAPAKKMPPSLEECTPAKTSNSARPYQRALRLPTPYSHPWQRQTRVVKGGVSQQQTAKLNEILAAKKTSMHGFLSASALLHLGKTHHLDELTLLSNVEFRRMCVPKLPEETFGCYIDIVRTKHKLNMSLWDLAQSIKFKLVSTLARDQAGASQLKMPSFEFYRNEGWASLKTGMRLDAITVTTADAAAIKTNYGPIRLTDLTLSVSLGTIGASYFLISMEREDALELNLCYVHPGVSDEQAKALLDTLLADLNAL